MPWTDKPGGSGNSGGNGSGDRGPWGQPPSGSNNGNGQRPGGNNQAPDLEELLKSGRERFRRAARGRGGNGGSSGGGLGSGGLPDGKVFGLAAIVALGLWLFSGFYTIPEGSRGIVTTFGKYANITPSGLNWHIPYPIQNVDKVNVEADESITIGKRTATVNSTDGTMLTSDLNIVDVDISINWEIKSDGDLADGELPNAAKFIFNLEGQENTIKAVAESALREVIGANEFEPIISKGRSIVPSETKRILQETLDSYDSGVEIIRVNFGRADPPAQVIQAQRDVIDARSEAEQKINVAKAFQNDIVPKARGEAQKLILDAQGYAARVEAEARGAASRFNAIYAEYAKAPEVTRERMYLETMEDVLQGMDKIVIDESAGGTVPYLSLNELQKKKGGQ